MKCIPAKAAMAALALLCALFAPLSHAFYLPGVPPKEYELQQKVDMRVNKLMSTKTQLPYRYYDLPFCAPEDPEELSENLGEVLAGDRIEESLYELWFGDDERCKVLCRREYNNEDAGKFTSLIDDEYTVNWVLDNLPAAVLIKDEMGEVHYERGFPLGYAANDRGNTVHYLFNHIRFKILYNKDQDSLNRGLIVGFQVEPFTVRHTYDGAWQDKRTVLKTCNDKAPIQDHSLPPQPIDGPNEVIFTYDVSWEVSTIKWSERWNKYLESFDDEIHWFSIVNSLMIVLFLTGMIAMIVLRALYRDIARYNEETAEDAQEETGWKLVHGDVFRPPRGFFGPMFLSVFVGSGMQIFMMTCALMLFAVLGFLSPANPGGLTTALLLLFVFMGSFAGFFSARLYKMFRGKAWKRNTLLTAVAFPGFVTGVAFFVNFFVWGEGSSAAIPFGTMFAIVVLWFGVSVPLVFLGAYFGFKKEELQAPVRVNEIPRQIPPQPWYLHPIPSVLVGGVLPFGAVFIELFFIMSSLWLQQVYYVFGFLLLVVLILIITCAEISIVMCYFQLCSEDYNWWWRSFLTSGSSAGYLFLYSILYFMTKLEIELFTSTVLYFGYMAIITFAFFLLTGCIGFISCLYFVRKIYSSIKVD